MPFELIMKTLFEHLVAYKDFYILLYQKDLFYLFRNTLKKLMIQDNQLSNPEAYAVAYMTYGIYGWIKEWIARGMQESPDDIYAFMEAQKQINLIYKRKVLMLFSTFELSFYSCKVSL